MRVFSDTGYGNGTIFVTPGADHPDVAEWQTAYLDKWGAWCKKPLLLAVRFANGAAEVPDNLGRYLIKHRLAKRWRFLVFLQSAPEEFQRRDESMKVFRTALCTLTLLMTWPALAAQQVINVGTSLNDHTGDTARAAGIKINDNFTDLYSFLYAPITGPVTIASGTNTSVLGAGVVQNSNLATAPSHTIKCNATGLTAAETDCTVATVNTMLGTSSNSNPYVINFCQQSGVDPTGVTNSRAALITALASSANGAAVIQVDCPVYISYGAATTVSQIPTNIGDDYTKPIFVPTGSSISMGPNGVFLVDNVAVNAFIWPGTQNTTWTNVNIEYLGHPGSNAISQTYGPASTQPGLFLNNTFVNYYTALWTSSSGVLGNKFTGSAAPLWTGPSAFESLLHIRGVASNLIFKNLHVFTPATATAPDFVFSVVQFSQDYNPGYLGASGTAITVTDYATASNSSIPTKITFDKPIFDGFDMGFVGGCGCRFISPTFIRYSDLQDGTGGATYFNATPASGAISAVLSTSQYPSGWPYETGTFALTMQLNGAVTAASWASNVATVTFAGGGTVPVGQQVQIAGVTPTGYNGIWTVTASSSGSVSFSSGTLSTGTAFGTIAQIIYAPITAGATSTGTWNTPIVQAGASAAQISGNMGGVAYFSAPPHALYMTSDAVHFQDQIFVDDAIDYGQYVGQAIRRPISGSGSLASFKWEAGYGSRIRGWISMRPDGCSDTYGSNNTNAYAVGAEMRNIVCIYDSRTIGIDGSYTPNWRILTNGKSFQNVVMDNITLVDVNPLPTQMPMGVGGSFENVSMTNIREVLNDFTSGTAGNHPSVLQTGNNLVETVELYFNQYSNEAGTRGVALISGSTFGTNQNVDIKLQGWMYRPVWWASPPAAGATTPPNLATGSIVFSSVLASGATSGTLDPGTYPNGFTGQTGAYYLTFGNGQSVTVQIANGATTTSNFSAALTSGAVSATATWGGWPYASCTCMVTLDDGRAEQVYVTFTYGSTTTSGSFAALSSTSTDSNAYATGMLQANFSGNTPREITGTNGGYDNRVHLYDVTNNYDQLMEGGILTEMWTQSWDGTPTSGSSQFSTPMIFPSTMAIDRKGLKIETALDTVTGGLTTIGVGFVGTGHATDLFTAISPAGNTDPYSNPTTTSVNSTGALVDITPTSGTFGNTGVIKLSLRGTQYSATN